MRFDPLLQVSGDLAYELEITGIGTETPCVIISSSYHAPLTYDAAGGELFVRAATGDEVTDTLTTGAFEPGDAIAWPGDVPRRLGRDLIWRECHDVPLEEEPAVRLWAGEVIFKTGRGLSGQFYIHEMAATAWAFSTALEQAAGDVFECQVVPYACIRRFAAELLLRGEVEARRLGRFDVSPLRPWGSPIIVALPNTQPGC